MQTVLKVNGISKSYGKKRVLDSVSITVRKGDVYGFVGRNGAGKTTLMNAIMGYEKADGTIRYDDVDVYKQYSQMKYKLIFNGKELNDSNFLIDYNVQKMQVIYIK